MGREAAWENKALKKTNCQRVPCFEVGGVAQVVDSLPSKCKPLCHQKFFVPYEPAQRRPRIIYELYNSVYDLVSR
jgi:hypothetical protein